MVANTQILDDRIDFNGIDVRRAPLQCAADIVARAGADDQHIANRGAAGIAVEQIRQCVGVSRMKRRVARNHLLMTNQIDANFLVGGKVIDPVIRRPELFAVVGRQRSAAPGHQHRDDEKCETKQLPAGDRIRE